MTTLDPENPWVFTIASIVLWILIRGGGTIEMIWFEGDLLSAVIQGAVGGAAFGVVFSWSRRDMR